MSDQSDSEDKHKKQVPVDPNLGDWSPDYFPTSPKTIFKRSLILLLGVGVLCFSVAYCSEHEDTSKESNPESTSTGDQLPTREGSISDDDTEVF